MGRCGTRVIWRKLDCLNPNLQMGWGPTRQVIARLGRDGYHVEQHAAAGAGYLSLWGARPTSEQALACQPPAGSAKRP